MTGEKVRAPRVATLVRPFDLADRREKIGVTIAQVANALDVNYERLRRWELGEAFPDLDLLDAWEETIRRFERERLAELLARHWERG